MKGYRIERGGNYRYRLDTLFPTFIIVLNKFIEEQLNEWKINFARDLRGFSSLAQIKTDMKQRRAATRARLQIPRMCTQ